MGLTATEWMDILLDAGYHQFVASNWFVRIVNRIIADDRDPVTILPVGSALEEGDVWYNAAGYSTMTESSLPQLVYPNQSPCFRPIVVIDLNVGHGAPPADRKCTRGHRLRRGERICSVCRVVWGHE